MRKPPFPENDAPPGGMRFKKSLKVSSEKLERAGDPVAWYRHRRTYTPAQIEDLAGVVPEATRVWRARGILSNYGVLGENGRWLFSLRDLVGFYIARRLGDDVMRNTGLDVAAALGIGWTNAPTVIDRVKGGAAAERYVAFLHRAAGTHADGLGGTEVRTARHLRQFEDEPFDRLEAIDLWYIAATLPQPLRGYIADPTPAEG